MAYLICIKYLSISVSIIIIHIMLCTLVKTGVWDNLLPYLAENSKILFPPSANGNNVLKAPRNALACFVCVCIFFNKTGKTWLKDKTFPLSLPSLHVLKNPIGKYKVVKYKAKNMMIWPLEKALPSKESFWI